MEESSRPAISELPLNCAHWGTYRVEARDGKVVALHGFEDDIDPSPIGPAIVDVLDHPARIVSPAARRSWLERGPGPRDRRKGSDPFVRISWDEAEKLVAGELDRVRENFGNQAIFAGSYGWASAGRFHHAQGHLRRFLNCIGGFTRSVNSYSLAAAEVVMPHIMGHFHKLLDESTSWPAIAGHCKLFVAFGGVPIKNGQINAGGVARHCQREGMASALRSGTKFVNVSPIRGDMIGDVAAEWLAPRPGTDVAVMLGMSHALYSEGLHDQRFLDRYTVGFDKFVQYLTGEADGVAKTAEWAAGISALAPEQIRDLARRMAGQRTMISVSWSLTRQHHGEQPYWAAVTLAAMLGQIGLPGGGIGFGYGAVNTIGDHYQVIPAASMPQGNNPVKDFIPVARISDMLLKPGDPFEYNGGEYRYPDIRLVYWAGGNPFHHHQDLNRLAGAWGRPETVIVHDWVWNSLARHADLVLPCTVSLERNDLAISRNPYIIHMQQAARPPAEARNDFDIFRGIAGRMGFEETYTEGLDETGWLQKLYRVTRQRMAARKVEFPPFEQLIADGWFRVEPPARPNVLLEEFRKDPETNRLRTPSGKIEIHSGTVAGFGYDDCPGHAVWLEPVEWLGDAGRKYPLHLLSNQPATKLHSQLDHGSVSLAAKVKGRETVTLHPADAAMRGIGQHDMVRVFNDRGACVAAAALDDSIRQGVVQMSTGAWFDPGLHEQAQLCKHGNPNVLTLDRGTSRLAQGPTAHTCLVDIARFEGTPPAVTAHRPPRIVERRRTGLVP